jgi:hypothetical protein
MKSGADDSIVIIDLIEKCSNSIDMRYRGAMRSAPSSLITSPLR